MTGEERARLEAALWRSLVQLGTDVEPERYVRELLKGCVALLDARRGYLALREEGDTPRVHVSVGCNEDQEEQIRSVVSTGIVAAAIEQGRTVRTESALSDSRFQARPSVVRHRIESVLCAPLGSPPVGVLYFQGRSGGRGFDASDEELLRELGAVLGAPLAALRATASRRRRTDPTRPFRERRDLSRLTGRSAGLAQVFEAAEAVYDIDIDVVITGPSGSGKNVLARLVHDHSPRARGPFVEVPCTSIPESLVEAELFGTLSGAFTGATERRGFLREAHGGTLFLDEVGDLPLSQQGRLLRVLESREVVPVGGTRPTRIDVRVIAATHVDLEEAVRAGRFRGDLFARLCVFPIRMPGLEERPEDVALLAETFVTEAARQFQCPRPTLSPGAMAALTTAEWPRQVRQLRHVVESAVARTRQSRELTIGVHHLFPQPRVAPQTWQEHTRELQKQLLRRKLDQHAWNLEAVREELDLSRSHLYELVRAFDLRR